jgi:hypothetical protein
MSLRMRARRLRVRAGGNALWAIAAVTVIVGLVASPAAPAKKPEKAKVPPGLAKQGSGEASGVGVTVEKTKAPKAAVTPVRTAKPVKVKAAKPEQQRGPRTVQ